MRRLLVLSMTPSPLLAIWITLLMAALGCNARKPIAEQPSTTAPGPEIIPLPENRDGGARLVNAYRTHDSKAWPDYAPAAGIHFDLPLVPGEVQQRTPLEAIEKARR